MLKIIVPNYKWLIVGGIITGFLSGIAGCAETLGAACFISLNLNPIAYISSEDFTALTIHITDTIVYQKYAFIRTK
ncbi:MAG: hypothetical protein ACYC25_11170 [Paludibacter sp.]